LKILHFRRRPHFEDNDGPRKREQCYYFDREQSQLEVNCPHIICAKRPSSKELRWHYDRNRKRQYNYPWRIASIYSNSSSSKFSSSTITLQFKQALEIQSILTTKPLSLIAISTQEMAPNTNARNLGPAWRCSGGAQRLLWWHNLTCGHTIQTFVPVWCGPNCAGLNVYKPMSEPFKCPACGDATGRWCELYDQEGDALADNLTLSMDAIALEEPTEELAIGNDMAGVVLFNPARFVLGNIVQDLRDGNVVQDDARSISDVSMGIHSSHPPSMSSSSSEGVVHSASASPNRSPERTGRRSPTLEMLASIMRLDRLRTQRRTRSREARRRDGSPHPFGIERRSRSPTRSRSRTGRSYRW
ncbi:hypothetical protein HDK64DRAFT_111315, partial [Phyllosticta capitalensis]